MLPAEERAWFRKGPRVCPSDSSKSLLFDPYTGETHFLGDLPALILSVIDDTALPLEELAERLAGPISLDETARAQINGALVFLEAAELVESKPRSAK